LQQKNPQYNKICIADFFIPIGIIFIYAIKYLVSAPAQTGTYPQKNSTAAPAQGK
jgi:hypothetical protein